MSSSATVHPPVLLIPEVAGVHKAYGTFSAPYLVTGSDGNKYVLKQGSGSGEVKLIGGNIFRPS